MRQNGRNDVLVLIVVGPKRRRKEDQKVSRGVFFTPICLSWLRFSWRWGWDRGRDGGVGGTYGLGGASGTKFEFLSPRVGGLEREDNRKNRKM